MTVIDASVLVDALVDFGVGGRAARDEISRQTLLRVPGIFAAEATSALRTMVLRGELSPIFATEALEEVRAIRSIRYAFEPFSERVWELRENLSVYDAWYVALAEWLVTDLATTDQRLMRAPGPRCPVRKPE